MTAARRTRAKATTTKVGKGGRRTISPSREKRYYMDGKMAYPSCSTVCKVIDKSGPLTWWASKEEREFMLQVGSDVFSHLWSSRQGEKMVEVSEPYGQSFRRKVEDEIFRRIGKQRAFHLAQKTAINIGNQAHAAVEHKLKTMLGMEAGPEPELSVEALNAFLAWDQWQEAVGLKPLYVEKEVYNTKVGYAGRLDHIAELGDHIAVVDVKTSKDIYPEHFLQLSGYVKAAIAEKLVPPDARGYIVLLPKKPDDPTTRIVEVENLDEHFKVFKSLIPAVAWMETYDK